jgi:pre-mRNA-splicing factor SYF2
VSVLALRVVTIAHACLARYVQHSSSLANRASLVEESAKAKLNARETARLERQRKLAEVLRSKADAEERGEDVERQKNWEWTIEENDAWEKKKARKARRADYEFHGERTFFDSSSEFL